MASGPITSWQIDEEKMETMTDFILEGPKVLAVGDCSHEIKTRLFLGRKAMTNLDSILKSRNITANKVPYSQSYGLSSSHVWMWELDHKDGWKNWCFWTMVLEKTLESLLYCKEIKSVKRIGNQSWIFVGRTDTEAETPILWPPDARSWFTGKDSGTGKDWGQEKESNRGRDGWMASPTQWTWVWANSGRWWRTGKPGVLQSMRSQRVRPDWVTE